ncbi:hypothetical protein BZY71_24915 [Leclercia adecarboxylata]|nr:hypothetical protein BZY71_24915 [Leclercia adecarboxylata]
MWSLRYVYAKLKKDSIKILFVSGWLEMTFVPILFAVKIMIGRPHAYTMKQRQASHHDLEIPVQ